MKLLFSNNIGMGFQKTSILLTDFLSYGMQRAVLNQQHFFPWANIGVGVPYGSILQPLFILIST